MKKIFLTLFVLALAMSACGAEDPAASLSGSWNLTSAGPAGDPVPAVPDTEAGLTFNEDGSVTGSSGCNGLGGSYTVEGDQVMFTEIFSTLMACEDPLMTQENAFHQVLTDTAAFRIDGNTLTITNNDMVLVLTK